MAEFLNLGGLSVLRIFLFDSAVLMFAVPAILVALTAILRSRRVVLMVTGVLITFGAINILATATYRWLSLTWTFISPDKSLGVTSPPSVWIGIAYLSAAFLLTTSTQRSDPKPKPTTTTNDAPSTSSPVRTT
ncbi:hypothetical protein [Sphaerisporangium corydalis]|uniref:Uncharacterized protein n=1 Tax=Sphaerisporangium corydalis TaxID=1441875 RepID=A0ABV9EIB6_9ACTN|nr:hypothetical protein [Sphaerisporangium corydalis]